MDRFAPVQAFIDTLPYVRATGMRVTALDAGRATLALAANPQWNGDSTRDRVHTGCLVALADTACGVAVGAALEARETIATLDLRMDYLRSASAGLDLVCEAHCHRLTRSIAFVRAEVAQPGGETVACVNATFMRATPSGPREGAAPARRPVPALDLGPSRPALPPGRSPYVEHLGVRVHPDPQPVFRLPFRPDLVGNPALPAMHGGVLAGFAETAMILHLAGASPELPKAIDFSVDYLRAAGPVDTFAQGITVRRGSRVAFVQVTLWQEDPSRPVVAARGHCLLA